MKLPLVRIARRGFATGARKKERKKEIGHEPVEASVPAGVKQNSMRGHPGFVRGPRRTRTRPGSTGRYSSRGVVTGMLITTGPVVRELGNSSRFSVRWASNR